MKPKVHIETTIPSFYHEVRTEPDMIARREWTLQWWDNFSSEYFLVTSIAVIDGLSKGDFPIKDQALELIKDLPLLPIEPAIAEIAEA
jgi:hypothetical protein